MHINRRLFGLAVGVHGFLPVLATISSLLAGVVILQMYLLSTIIADAYMGSHESNLWMFYMLAFCIACRGVLLWFRERFAQRSAVTIKSSIRKNLLKHTFDLGPAYMKNEKTGQMVATITDGVEKLDDYFTKYIPSMVHIAILPVVIIIFCLIHDWPSGLIMLITGPLIIFFMALIGSHAKKLTQNQWRQLSSLSSHFLDALQGLKTLKIFGMNHREADKVDENSNRFRLITMQVLGVAFLSGVVLELAASISIALVAVQIGIRLIEGMMYFQTGLFILLLAPEFYLPFRTLGSHHHAGMEGAAAAKSILEISDLPPIVNNIEVFTDITLKAPAIEFRDVIFSYPDAGFPVLNTINCTLEPGTLTAIVGPTGAGKTTFAHILIGFLKPTSGNLFINDISLDEIGMQQWRKNVAYVPQHPVFFNGTVLENLLMANGSASLEQVEYACRQAEAQQIIEQLPLGFNTQLSENASRLSGGEKQRLSIARAFLKDAPLLILDEPTSNLDPDSEKLIALATERIIKGRTTLIIAHRLNTVKKAHRILVIKDGTIAESGNHDQLIRKKGVYASYLKINENNGG